MTNEPWVKEQLKERRETLSNKFRVVPYNIMGVKLYSVEDELNWILKYCSCRKDAQDECDELNKREQGAEDDK